MDDNEIQNIFADGESWPLHWDFRRYLMEERSEQDRWLTDLQVLEQLSMSPTGVPAKGGYVWKIEGDIGINYWWAHLDVWGANQKVRSCCHTVVTPPGYSIPVSRKFTQKEHHDNQTGG